MEPKQINLDVENPALTIHFKDVHDFQRVIERQEKKVMSHYSGGITESKDNESCSSEDLISVMSLALEWGPEQ